MILTTHLWPKFYTFIFHDYKSPEEGEQDPNMLL